MDVPAVSVVVRAFNCQKYIAQAIESILAQTFENFEVVVVEDASTDETLAILKSYAQQDSRVRIIRNDTNQGPVKTMNIGLKQACGEFVAVQDADDLSLPHRLEIQVDFLRTNPHIALVGGGAFLIDGEGERVEDGERIEMGPEEVRQSLAESNTFVHSSLMFRRECIEAIGFYDEFFAYAHDYDMLIRMADTFDVVRCEQPLVERRWLNTGITGRKQAAQTVYAELARVRLRANKDGVPMDIHQEYDRLMSEYLVNHRGHQSMSNTRYYYSIGMLLLRSGKSRQARRRFWKAIVSADALDICMRAIVFYLLSFLPGAINAKPVRMLREMM